MYLQRNRNNSNNNNSINQITSNNNTASNNENNRKIENQNDLKAATTKTDSRILNTSDFSFTTKASKFASANVSMQHDSINICVTILSNRTTDYLQRDIYTTTLQQAKPDLFEFDKKVYGCNSGVLNEYDTDTERHLLIDRENKTVYGKNKNDNDIFRPNDNNYNVYNHCTQCRNIAKSLSRHPLMLYSGRCEYH